MGLNLKSVFSSQFLLLLTALLLITGCASIQKPQGGPRDRTPPKLLLATPVNQTRNFKEKTIKLDFDEYFKLVNQFQEITISPAMEKPMEVKTRQKSLVINFKDTLTKNTTYVINFGKGIADVNEGNVMKNFTYVFSTGPHIDSLSISGTVTNNETNEKVKDATVMLFPANLDSAYFGKKKPAIYTTSDSSGTFNLANLHDGDYRIYALKESAPNKIYDKDDELIAFQKQPVHLTSDVSNIKMSLFKQTPEKFRVTDRHFDPDGKMVFIFNKSLIDPVLKINYPAGLDAQKIVDFSKTRDTALLYLKNTNFDSISVSFIDKGVILDTVTRTKSAKETYERLVNLSYNINPDNLLKPGTDLLITAAQPIESTDASRIILLEDSVDRAFTLTRDVTNPKKFAIKYRWKQGARYQIAFNDGSFVNIYGDKNKRAVRQFQVDKLENYGAINLKVNVPDTARSYIIELLNNAKQVVQTNVIKKNTTISYKNFIAAKYTIRVTYDNNNNGRWDSGNVKSGLFPENIFVIPVTYTIRPNWEAEETVDIPVETGTP